MYLFFRSYYHLFLLLLLLQNFYTFAHSIAAMIHKLSKVILCLGLEYY